MPSLSCVTFFVFPTLSVSKHPREKHNEAKKLLERVLVIRTKALGESHPDTVKTQNSIRLLQDEVCGAYTRRSVFVRQATACTTNRP